MRSSSATIVEPRIDPDRQISTVHPQHAAQLLRQFCIDNGHQPGSFRAAMQLLLEAAKTPGKRVHVHYTYMINTMPRHDCLEDIVAHPQAQELAMMAVDLAPGTRLRTELRHDACEVWIVATNAAA